MIRPWRYGVAGVGLALLSTSLLAQEMRSLATVKDFPAFQVLVPKDKQAWCGETARVTISGQTREQFEQNQPVIEKTVGGLGALMSFECPQAKTIVVTGMANGQPVYQASASSNENWKLVSAEFRTAEQLQLLADIETVGRCDELGAAPGDPEAVSPGVSDDALDSGAVVGNCRKAVALDDETPRLKFQLARGLIARGAFDDATEQLLPAAEAGHGGALALLADMQLEGVGGFDADPVAAKALYQKAADAGFDPARAMLAKFDDQTELFTQAEAEERQAAAEASRPKPVSQGRAVSCEIEVTWGTPTGDIHSYEYITIEMKVDRENKTIVFTGGGVPLYDGNPLFLSEKIYRGEFGMNGVLIIPIEKFSSEIKEGELYFHQSNYMTFAETFDSGARLFGMTVWSRIFGRGTCQ